MANKENYPRLHYLWLALVLLLSLALRLLLLDKKPFWSDEGATWWMALGEVQYQAPRIFHDAFYWSIKLFGWNEFAGRFPSVIYGTVSVLLIYLLCRSLWDRRTGLLGAFLISISPFLIAVSQEVRHYSLAGMWMLAALWCVVEIVRSNQFRLGWWLLLLVTSIMGQMTHCFFIFFLGITFLVMFFHFGRWRGWNQWLPMLGILVVTFLVHIKLVMNSLALAGTRAKVFVDSFSSLLDNVYSAAINYYCFLFGNYIIRYPDDISTDLLAHPPWLAGAVFMGIVWIIAATAAFFGMRIIWKQEERSKPVIVLLLITMFFYTFVFIVINVSTPVHAIFAAIPFLILVIGGLSRVPGRIFYLVLYALILTSTISLIDYYKRPLSPFDQTNWRDAGKYLAEHQKSDDAVLFLRARDAYFSLKFYDRDLPRQAYYRPKHEPDGQPNRYSRSWWMSGTLDDKVLEVSSRHNRLWVVETLLDWAPPDSLQAETIQIGDHLQLHLIQRGISEE